MGRAGRNMAHRVFAGYKPKPWPPKGFNVHEEPLPSVRGIRLLLQRILCDQVQAVQAAKTVEDKRTLVYRYMTSVLPELVDLGLGIPEQVQRDRLKALVQEVGHGSLPR